MQRLVGIFREEADLAEALTELDDAQAHALDGVRVVGGRAYNPGWNLAFELRNLLIVSEAITRSARLRTESRGAHSRIDFPATDDAAWGHRNSVIAKAPDGAMTATTAPLPGMPDALRDLLGTH